MKIYLSTVTVYVGKTRKKILILSLCLQGFREMNSFSQHPSKVTDAFLCFHFFPFECPCEFLHWNIFDVFQFIKIIILVDAKKWSITGRWWLTPVILATQEAEIRKIVVQSQPGKIVFETLSRKHSSQKKGWWGGSGYRPWVQTPVKKKKVTHHWLAGAASHWLALVGPWSSLVTSWPLGMTRCLMVILYISPRNASDLESISPRSPVLVGDNGI
jgi:hypothetical protein